MAKNKVTFNVTGLVDLDTSQLIQKVNNAKSILSKLNVPSNVESSFTNLFKKISEQITDFEQKSKRTFTNMDEIKAAEKSYQKLQGYISELSYTLEKVDTSKLSLKDKSLLQGLTNGTKYLTNFEKAVTETESEMTKLQGKLSKKLQTKIDVSSLVKAAASGEDLGRQLATLKGQNTRLKVDSIEFANAQKEVNKLSQELNEARVLRDQLHNKAKSSTATSEDTQNYLNQVEQVKKLSTALKEVETYQKQLYSNNNAYKANLEVIQKITEEYNKLKSLATNIDFKNIFGDDFDEASGDVQRLKTLLDSLQSKNVDKVNEAVDELATNFKEAEGAAKSFGDDLGNSVTKGAELENLNNQVESLRQNFMQFFSLTNGWYLLQQAIRNAFETVKELDASMTEIAVVSDYTLDQIWSMRQQYSDAASEMGSKTIDLVDATKLYVQQGLDLNKALEVGIETTKMARIANLDGAYATDLMTAALRGYNMEMTEANRVNDVYSELAAKTAADTEEIAVAMSKTASIAYNAGASFENMSAFLTQIIETTREAPETAGTAMKTIIARFQELKKPMSEIGEVDGEVVDANKIEGALREAGVALRDTNGEFRNFDDVILELASKWDTLDKMTQRYIATQAAGSRQQSRFLALMEDSDRLLELTGYAANSAGAATEQFEKTQDSLQSKLNKLNNALDMFYTGLANNTVIKITVDLLTELVEAINSLTGALPGPLGSIAQLLILIGAFKGATKIINGLFTSFASGLIKMQKQTGQAGASAGRSFTERFGSEVGKMPKKMRTYAKAINLQFAKSFKGKSGNAFQALIDGFNKVPQEIQSEIHIRMPQIGQSIENDFKNAIDYDALDKTGKALADKVLEGFNQQLQAGDTQGALINLRNNTRSNDWSKFGGKNSKELPITPKTIDTLTQSMDTLGSATSNVGSIFYELGYALDSVGLSGAANIVMGLGTAFSSLGGIISTVGAIATTAGISAQAAWGWIGAIVLGVSALAVGIGLAVKNAEENSIENRMEEAAKATEDAEAAADAASSAYDELLSKKDEYDDIINGFEGLEQGTNEWTNALIKANNIISELIAKYPELAKYMTINEYGANDLTDEGWQVAQDEQLKSSQISQGNVAISQLNKAELKKESKLRGAIDETGFREGAYSGKIEEAFNALYDSYKQNAQILEEEVKRIVEDTFVDYEDSTRQSIAEIIKDNVNGIQDAFEEMQDLETNDIPQLEKQIFTSLIPKGEYSEALNNYFLDDFKNIDLEEEIQKKADELTEGIDNADIAQKAKDRTGRDWGSEKENLQHVYADMYNIDVDDIEEQLADDKDELARRIAEYDLTEGYKEQIDKMSNEIDSAGSAIKDVLSGSLDANTDAAMQEVIENNSEELQTMVGKTVGDIEAARADLDKSMAEIFGEEFSIETKIGSYDVAQQFSDLYDTISSEMGDVPASFLKEIFSDLDSTAFQEATKELSNINWSSAIDGATALRKGLESSSEAVRMLSEGIQGLDLDLYSVTNQANEFYTALDEDTFKELREDGEITGTELAELSNKFPQLQDLLDNTGVSINSLGDYFNLLEEGVLSTDDATLDFLQTLDKLKAAENTIRDTFTFMDTFEPSRSQTEISDYFSDMRERMTELYEKGAYSDNQLVDYAKAVVGEDKWQQIVQESNNNMQTAMSQVMQQVQSYGENLYGAWVQFASSDNGGMAAVGSDGSIQFDMEAIGSVDNLKNAIMEQGRSEEFANAMIAEAQTYTANFKQALSQLSLGDALADWLKDAFVIDDKLKLSEKEVQAFAAEAGYSPEEIVDAINKMYEQNGKNITVDLVPDINIAEGEKEVNDSLAKLMKASDNNLNAGYEYLISVGLDDEAARAKLTDFMMDIDASGSNVTFQWNGKTMELAADQLDFATMSAIVNGVQSEEVFTAQQFMSANTAQTLSSAVTNALVATLETIATGFLSGLESGIQSAVSFLQSAAKSIPVIGKNLASMIPDPGSISLQGAKDAVHSVLQGAANKINETTSNYNMNTAMVNIGKFKSNFTSDMGEQTASNLGGGRKTASSYNNKKAQSAGRPGGSWGSGSGGGSGGSGGSSSKEEDPWVADYDWLYNLVEKTNEEIRKRNKLEWEYDQILKNRKKSAADLLKNLQDQEASLKRQQDYYDQQMSGRMKEQTDLEREYSDVKRYAQYNENLGYVEIDWNAINALSGKQGNNETGERIDEYISKLEKLSDQIDEIEDAQMDIVDQLDEIEEMGRDEYLDLEQRVYDAIVQLRQDEIDNLQDLNDSINEANENMLDKIQQGIDDYRDARDQEDNLNDIQEMERRLALMQSDTSGANVLDILQLRDELEQARQDYTDSLIDKSIQEMTDQNQEAYEQRNRQIELMQAQLEFDQENGKIAQETNAKMTEALVNGPKNITNLLKQTDVFKGMAAGDQEDWIKTISEGYAAGAANWVDTHDVSKLGLKGKTITFTDRYGAQKKGVVQSDGRVKVGNVYYDGVYQAPDGSYQTSLDGTTVSSTSNKKPASKPSTSKTIKVGGLINAGSAKIYDSYDDKTGETQYYKRDPIYKVLQERNGRYQVRYYKLSKGVTGWFKKGDVKAYAKGGLVDSTGLAWLDGTKTKPEMVLKPQDTENLIALKNILADAVSGTGESGGDNYYDIHIEVDQLSNDYDVEQLMQKMQRMIVEDAAYRNVNALEIGRR